MRQMRQFLSVVSQCLKTIAEMIREGKIKERTIKTKGGKGIHSRIYLKKENPKLIDRR